MEDTHEIESYFYGMLEKDILKNYKAKLDILEESSNCKAILREFYIDDMEVYINVRAYNKDEGRACKLSLELFLNNNNIAIGITSFGTSFQYGENYVDMLLACDIEDVKEIYNIKNVSVKINEVDFINEENDCVGYEEEKHDIIKGAWNFDFEFNIKKVLDETNYIDVDKYINIENQEINITRLRTSPIGIKLKLIHKNYNTNDSIEIGILDDNGEIRSLYSGHGENDNGVLVQTNEFIMKTQDLSKINIVPYKNTKDEKKHIYENSILTLYLK